jgi:hypothetical protein
MERRRVENTVACSARRLFDVQSVICGQVSAIGLGYRADG